MVFMHAGVRPPVEIQAGFPYKGIDDLRTDVVRQFIDMRLDIVVLHAHQQNWLSLEAGMLAELLPQVGNKGIIQPFRERRSCAHGIRPVIAVVSGTGGKTHQPTQRRAERPQGSYAACRLHFNITSPLGMMVKSPPSRFAMSREMALAVFSGSVTPQVTLPEPKAAT